MKIYKFSFFAWSLVFCLGLAACGVYSFTGVAITAKTISIENFYNDADGGPPDMAQTFTNKLRDYYQQNTNLAFVANEGEIQLEGAVTSYRLTPIAPSAGNSTLQGDAAALTRLTITVSVTYLNVTDETFDFDNKQFSFYSDFDNSQNITSIEDQLIDEIYDQIILDIFNASVANW